MSRRDVIIIAILMNVALLGLLFVLATREEVPHAVVAEKIPSSVMQESESRALEVPLFSVNTHPNESESEPLLSTPSPQVIEVTVKKGDSLEKIARTYGSTVEAIILWNGLKNNRIDVGDVLKVPKVSSKDGPTPSHSPVMFSGEGEFYVLKKGDSPWKIARKFHMNFEDLLKLNHLDEEKARNLKVGDKIRIR